jgi:hypothetical protein
VQHLHLTTRTERDWTRRFVDEKDYDTLLNENATVYKPDGSPLMVLLKGAIPLDLNLQAWSILKNYNAKTENRGSATGIKSEYRTKEDGTKSKVLRSPKGWEVSSGIIGFFERTIRMPYCHACSWNAEHPELFNGLLPLVELVDAHFKEHVPERWAAQRAIADTVNPAWLIGKSVFSTLTVNKNFRTSCHKDAGDLPEGFSAMTVIRDGKYLGGNLVLPDFRVAAGLDTGDLILFDPHEFHGNTQICALTAGAQRCSIVYYMREKMPLCSSPEAELSYAKNRKQGDSLFPGE